jgi:hypothetical protein
MITGQGATDVQELIAPSCDEATSHSELCSVKKQERECTRRDTEELALNATYLPSLTQRPLCAVYCLGSGSRFRQSG